ncbi:MAG: Verru_Chthon cassette protein B [Chthoniobacteraceae bacterium]
MKNHSHSHNRGSIRGAFSLIEVTIAMGIISFAVTALVALLPGGLQAVRDSATETSLSAIVRQVRSELNQASFTDVTTQLPSQTWYFSEAGLRLVDTNTTDRFFAVTFSATTPELAGQADSFEESARSLLLTVSYPSFAPAASQKQSKLTILAARQTSQ